MSLTIVRHGESVWNKQNLFTGFKDVELSEEGIKEADMCGKEIKKACINMNFDIAFTSNLQRAFKTCETIRSHLDYNFDIIQSENLNERDYGDLTGLNKKETADKYGEEQVQLWRRSVHIRPPNGENLIDVIERVKKYYTEFILPFLEANKNILIVAHGNSIRALLVVLEVFSIDVISNFEIPTGKPMYVSVYHGYSFVNNYIITGRQILDSRGNPTIESELQNLESKVIGRGTAPSGASTGSNEAVELRDGDENYFMGKGVWKAINNLISLNQSMYLDDKTLKNLIKCDNQLMFIDGTQLKKNLGGNTTTAASFLFADVGAKLNNMELFQYFSDVYGYNDIEKRMPIPMVNILNGGKHAGGNLKIQEFMIMPSENVKFSVGVEHMFIVYNNLKKILKKNYGPSSINLGDEGGFAPNLNTAEEALNMIENAVEESNLKLGEDIFLALDCAASEFYDKTLNKYEIEPEKFITSEELCKYYVDLLEKHPALRSIEDGFDEKDYDGWKMFTKSCGSKLMIVGDDLFTTNPELINTGMEEEWANSLLLKVNQIGTITESVKAAKMMQEKNCDVIVSHRSGETNNTLISDLAVGINAKYIKLGAPARGERVAKYNRLLQIQELI
jgi:enolase